MTILFLAFIVVPFIAIGLCFLLADRFSFYFSLTSRKLLFALSLWLFIAICAGSFALVHTKNPAAILVHWLTSCALGLFIYLIISTIFIELLRIAFRFNPKYAGFAILLCAFSITVYGIYNAYQLKVSEKTIVMKNLPQPVKALHITDTHIGQFRGKKQLQALVEVINNINPDVVLHTGDLLDSRVHLDKNVLSPLAKIKAPLFFVHGNHDQDTGMLAIAYELQKLKVNYLQNRMQEFKGIQIIGLDYMLPDENAYAHLANKRKRATVKSIIQQLPIDKNKPSIVLHHSPSGTQYAAKAGIDLYLAGHTHGGQIFPFNLLNEFIFEFNAGLYDLEGMKVHIPFGVGTFGPPMRVGTKSEMTILNLVPEK